MRNLSLPSPLCQYRLRYLCHNLCYDPILRYLVTQCVPALDIGRDTPAPAILFVELFLPSWHKLVQGHFVDFLHQS